MENDTNHDDPHKKTINDLHSYSDPEVLNYIIYILQNNLYMIQTRVSFLQQSNITTDNDISELLQTCLDLIQSSRNIIFDGLRDILLERLIKGNTH
jgi:hypothetical protein